MNIQAFRAFSDWLLDNQGSTRPIALFRIALVLLVWTRFASDLALWSAVSWSEALFSLLFFTSSTAALVGFHTRWAMGVLTAVLALVYFRLGLGFGYQPWTHHHVYLLFICTFLTTLGPCDKSLSLDRMRALSRGSAWEEQGSLTANRLILLQLAAIYFWTAIDKSNPTFLSGLRLEQIMAFHYADAPFGGIFLAKPLIVAAAISVVIIEYALAAMVLLRKPLMPVFLIGFSLHGLFFVLLPVNTFSLTMLAMYIFLPPASTVHNWSSKFVGNECRPLQAPLDQR